MAIGKKDGKLDRAAAKAASRARDEERLASGQISAKALRAENFAFAGANLKRSRILGRFSRLARPSR